MRRGFTIHHNGPPANCVGRGHQRCLDFWAAVKAFHTNPEPIGKGWSDIAYSFGVCPHGERLTGRGWNQRQWANGSDMVGSDDGDDSDWYTVLVFVGGDDSTQDNETPTPEMVRATRALIAEGRASGRCGNRVLPHNFFKRKPCPGPEFTALAKAWDNATLTIPQEDDMTPADHEKIEAAMEAAVASAVKQAGAFITTGRPTTIFDPKVSGNEWMAAAPSHVKLLAAVNGIDVTLDAAAVAEAIPDDIAQDVVDLLAAKLSAGS